MKREEAIDILDMQDREAAILPESLGLIKKRKNMVLGCPKKRISSTPVPSQG
ncbi:MAG: hypothetical protein U5L00_13595 [Desulfovermiculus sp.]|nr:hypothetical protein [Desulfovermiculus sp.]